MKQNIVAEKSYQFAVDIVRLYKLIVEEKKEFVLSKQLLRSGTSIGANVEEAIGGYSKKDFRAKFGIAYKEAQETKYWLKLLNETDYLPRGQFQKMYENCDELSRIIFSIMKSSKAG